VAEWKWFGHPGHLCVSDHCRFHLTTQVGHYLVSTVGEYVPPAIAQDILAECRGKPLEGIGDAREADWMRKFGFEELGLDRTYETMVFPAGKPCHTRKCNCGMPDILQPNVDMEGYRTAPGATLGHYALCRKWQDEPAAKAEDTTTVEEAQDGFRALMDEILEEEDPYKSAWEPGDDD
jgi:hypothetical protein